MTKPNAAHAHWSASDRTDALKNGANPPLNSALIMRQRRSFRRTIILSLIFADMAALLLAFGFGNYLVYETDAIGQLGTLLAAALPLQLLFGSNDGAYRPRTGIELGTSVYRAWKAFSLTGATLVLLIFLLKVGPQVSRVQFVVGITLGFVMVAGFRAIIARIFANKAAEGLFTTLHIYDDIERPLGAGPLHVSAEELELSPDRSEFEAVNAIGILAKGMDSVAVHCLPANRLRWAVALKALDVPGEIIAPDLDALGTLGVTMRDGHTSLVLSGGTLRWEQQLLKRLFDLTLTIPLLPIFLIIFAIVAVAIKLDSRGPVFFRQDRIGSGNRRFRMWKFRSMQADQADPNAAQLTLRDDPRVTRVGAFLRRTSIDELPQLFNVIASDMSLVGPRPHAPMAKAGSLLYWEVDESYWDRHVVKPGITGLAQIRGHRGNTFAESHLVDRLQADLEYVAQWSLLLDLRILIATLAVPFHKNAF
jgi:polysaccharide biosynthesis protein PslA